MNMVNEQNCTVSIKRLNYQISYLNNQVQRYN